MSIEVWKQRLANATSKAQRNSIVGIIAALEKYKVIEVKEEPPKNYREILRAKKYKKVEAKKEMKENERPKGYYLELRRKYKDEKEAKQPWVYYEDGNRRWADLTIKIDAWVPPHSVVNIVLPKNHYNVSFTLKIDDGKRVLRRPVAKIFDGGDFQTFIAKVLSGYSHSVIAAAENIVIRRLTPKQFTDLGGRNTMLKAAADFGTLETLSSGPDRPGQCFVDAVLTAALIKGLRIDRQDILTVLNMPLDWLSVQGVTPTMGRDVAEKMNFSFYVFDPFHKLITKYVAERCRFVVALLFNNDHYYSILSPALKKQISANSTFSLTAIEFHEYDKAMLIDKLDISEEALLIMQETGTMICHLEATASGRLVKFVHPVTKVLHVAAPDLKERKIVLEKLHQETKYEGFRFKNQSWSRIAQSYAEVTIGQFRQSDYPSGFMQILEVIDIRPVLCSFKTSDELFELSSKNPQSIDGKRRYTNIIKNMKHSYPVFNFMDMPQKEEPKHGYVEMEFRLGQLNFPRNWWPLSMLYDLRELKIDTKIFGYFGASHWILPEHFSKMANNLMSLFPKYSKNLINHFIGTLGKKYDVECKMAVTNSLDVCDAMFTTYNCSFYDLKGMYFLRSENKKMKFHGSLPIWHQIIATGIIELHKQTVALMGPKSILLGYNTDSVKIINPLKIDLLSANLQEEKYWPPYGTWERDESKIMVEHVWSEDYGLVLGAPGSGKTRWLCEMANNNDLIACWTHRAVENINLNNDNKKALLAVTLDHVFGKNPQRIIIKQKRIFVDECSMITWEHWRNLWYQKNINPNLEIILIGDDDQCLTLDGTGVDLMTHPTIKFLVNNKMKRLPYNHLTGRYDAVTQEKLFGLVNMGVLKCQKTEHKFPKMTICRTPWMRKVINEEFFEKFAPKGVELGQWFVGCPVISYGTFEKGSKVKNSHYYHIVGKQGSLYELKRSDGLILHTELSHDKWRYGWCETIRRWQGGSIDHEYNIVEVDKMDLRELNTAIGRTTKWSNIGLDSSKLLEKYERQKKTIRWGLINPVQIVDGHFIYKYESDTILYVGRTNDPIRRDREHQEQDPQLKGLVMEITETVFATKKQIDELETHMIQKAECGKMINKKKLKPKVIQEFRVKILSTRFTPKDQPLKKRFRIQYQTEEIRFSYTNISKAEAYAQALQKQQDLLHKFGL